MECDHHKASNVVPNPTRFCMVFVYSLFIVTCVVVPFFVPPLYRKFWYLFVSIHRNLCFWELYEYMYYLCYANKEGYQRTFSLVLSLSLRLPCLDLSGETFLTYWVLSVSPEKVLQEGVNTNTYFSTSSGFIVFRILEKLIMALSSSRAPLLWWLMV